MLGGDVKGEQDSNDLPVAEQELAAKFYAKLQASRIAGRVTPEKHMKAEEVADWFTVHLGSETGDSGQVVIKRRFTIRDVAAWVSWLCTTRGALIISSRDPKNPGYCYALNRAEMEPTLAMLRATRLKLEERENRILANLNALEKAAKEESQGKLFEQNVVDPPALEDLEEHPVITALQNELGAEKIG